MAYPQDKGQMDKVLNTGRIFYGGDGTNFYPVTVDSSGNLQLEILAGTASIGVMGHNITGIGDGRIVVAASGTAIALTASSLPAKIVIVTAETDNTNLIVAGGSTVVAALSTRRGTPLYAGDSVTFPVDDVADVFIDSLVTTEGATYVYLS